MRKNVLIFGHNDATQFIDIFNQYTRLFDPAKYLVTVVYLTGEENPETRQRTIAEEVIFLNIPKKKIRGVKIGAIRQMLALTRKKNFEIVICHRYKPSYIMLWIGMMVRIPALICVMHELGTMSSFGRKLLMGALWKNTVYFAGVSNAVRDDLRRSLLRIPEQNIVTLYNVIDADLTEPDILSRDEARKALRLSEDDFIFGNIGRLVRNKDQATLIHAFSLIKPYCPKAKLIIMGEGELETRLVQQVQDNGLSDSVLLTGFVPNAVRYIRAFDCFVLSSIQEAFGRVLIEAMLARCPIIATAVNGVPEVMANTGIVIPPRDAIKMSQALRQMFDATPAKRKEMANLAYQHMQDNFSIPAFQRQFWKLPVFKSQTTGV